MLKISRTGFFCLALLGPLLAASPAAQAQDSCKHLLASGNPQYPPYLWRAPDDENKLIGANAELMQWLSKEIGLPIEVRYVGPWGRVQEEVRSGKVDLIAGAFFTVPRTEYMDYFHPSFRDTRSAVWTKGGSKLKYRRWGDLRGRQGVTVINNSFGEEFDRYARENLKITQVASLEQAIQIVQKGRADYLVYEDSPGDAFLAKMAITDVKQLDGAVAKEPLHVTLSHKSACNTPELRGKIARALYKLSRTTQMNDWIAQSIQLWRKQNVSQP